MIIGQIYIYRYLQNNLYMIRPGTAHPSRISQIMKVRQRRTNFNQSKNSIAPGYPEQAKEEDVDYGKEAMNEVKSQNPQGPTQEGSKVDLAMMLMKFQLNKMGFGKKQYQNVIENFVRNANLQQIKYSNIKQWVLGKRSQVVQFILREGEYQEKLQKLKINGPQQYKQSQVVPIEMSRVQIHEKSQISQSLKSLPVARRKIQLKVEEQNNSKVEELSFNLILCPICLVDTRDYLKRNCGHTFCKDCVRSYFLENISTGNYIIDCPEMDCNQKMSEEEAVLVLNQQQYDRFVRFKHKTILENDPNNKFCNRPDCGQLLIEMKDKKLFCKACNIIFCPMCQEPLHPGKQCGEALEQELDKTYKNLKIKKCPKCGSPIQKIDGCNHMTCKKCKQQFCWICLGPYTPYHYRIYNCCGCPGLQFDEAEEIGFKRFMQILFFVFLPVIIGLAITSIFLMLPLFMLYDFITKPCRWISSSFDSYSEQKCEVSILQTLCCFLPDCLIAFLCYFALLPRAALYCAFISPVEYTAIIINILCNIV